jgi:hypothetical protein
MNKKIASALGALAAATLLLPSCGLFFLAGDGNLVQLEPIDASAVTGISVRGVLDAELSSGLVPSVTLIIDENLADKIDVSVDADGTLIVAQDPFVNLLPTAGATLLLVLPSLEKVEITGMGNVSVTGFDGPWALEARITGTGDIDIVGAATSLVLSSTGTGKFLGRNFGVQDADVTITGTGDAEVQAASHLDYTLTGTGDLLLWGDPALGTKIATGTGRLLRQ